MFPHLTRTAVLLALAVALQPAATNAQENGGIEGRVVDTFGTSVGGATVTATSVSGYRTEAVSGQQGDFEVALLVPGTYTVRVTAAGYIPADRTVTVGATERLQLTLILVPRTPSSLMARIVDPQRGALPGALVLARGPNGVSLEAAADEIGRVVFPGIQPGTRTLTASLSGFHTESTDIVVPFAGTAEAELELPLD